MSGPGTYKDKLAPVLRSAHKDFLEFKRAEKLQCSQPRFTPARLNRKLQSSSLVQSCNVHVWGGLVQSHPKGSSHHAPCSYHSISSSGLLTGFRSYCTSLEHIYFHCTVLFSFTYVFFAALCHLGFPGLQSKAMAGKFLSLWLEHRAIQFASREGASEDDKTMCVCISTYCSIIRLMGAGKHILSEQEAKLFKELVLRHLHAWVYMHTRGLKLPKGRPGKRTYQLLPKLHHLWHLAFDTESTRLNPVNTQLMTAESFIGSVGRTARACHRASVANRTLERYLCKLHLKIQEIS